MNFRMQATIAPWDSFSGLWSFRASDFFPGGETEPLHADEPC